MTHNQSSVCNVARQQHFMPCFKAMFQWVHISRLERSAWNGMKMHVHCALPNHTEHMEA